jgi:hypothetical protein
MVLVGGGGVPLGVHLSSANLAECQLAETTLAQVAKPQRQKLRRIGADRGYDSRGLHDQMARQGIELLVPLPSLRPHRPQAVLKWLLGSKQEPPVREEHHQYGLRAEQHGHGDGSDRGVVLEGLAHS